MRALAPPRPPPRPAHHPSVSVIRPIKGLDPGVADNLRAALEHDYPGWFETLFVFDDEREPALAPARRAIAERRARGEDVEAHIVLCGEPPAGRTGKLHAMIAGLREARGELVAFVDSDTRAGPQALRELVAALREDPGAGAAFAAVVSSEPPVTVGDAGYALLLNGLYGPVAAATAVRNDGALPFVMGQFSVLTRPALAAIGGLESAEGQLVDDMVLGARIHAAGFRNLLVRRPVPIVQRGLSLRGFWELYVRWITFSRGLKASGFKARAAVPPLLFWLGLLLVPLALRHGWWFAAALGALLPLAVASSTVALHRRAGGAPAGPRTLAASFLLPLAGPFIVLSVAFRNEVEWRGRRYRLDRRAQLAAAPSGSEPPGDRLCWEDRSDGVPVPVACGDGPSLAGAGRILARATRPRDFRP